jgi:FKBP-type peptidyl-prolyl cis-trans isomerase
MKKNAFIAIALLAAACSTEGVTKDENPIVEQSKPKDDRLTAEKLLEPKRTIVAKKEYPNGIRIQWFEKGTGEALQDGEVYEINYKVKLDNGQVVDGNHLLRREMLPFLVGFQMQGTGWDMAMKEMHVGDFTEVYLPANLVRGKKGIDGVIPPNSPNIVFLRIGKRIKPTRVVDGTKVWLLEEQKDNEHIITDKSAIALHFFVGAKSNPRYDNSYQRNTPFKFNMADRGLVPGLRKALINAKLYDKLWIIVPADQAYGSKGYLDLVDPNESMFYDIFVNEVDGHL